MKKTCYFLTILCALLLTGLGARAQTTLSAGDVAIIGYNADGSSDNFSFILLTSVAANTSINFTDFGWCSDGSGFQKGNPSGCSGGAGLYGAAGDGAITWTTASALPCGTEVWIHCQNSITASVGSVTGLQGTVNVPTDYVNLAIGGDQIFAFQGTLTSPTLITGMSLNGAWDATLTACEFTSSKSTLPAAISSYAFALLPEVDNAKYNCTVTANSPANLRTAIFNSSNWTVDDAANVSLPLGCSFSCSSCTAPSISADPANQSMCVTGTKSFSVTASGTGLSYQWQFSQNGGSNFNDLSNGAPYSGVTSSTLTVTNPSATLNNYQYRCVVTGTCGSATSNAATLTVSNPTASISSQTNIACNGGATGAATASVTGGTPTYTYSWSNGANTASITGLAAGVYTCTVTDGNGCTATTSATITEPAPVPMPVVSTPVIYPLGATASPLTATGTNLLWYTSISGTGSSTAPTPGTAVAGTTSYWVSQTNGSGCESPLAQIDVIITVPQIRFVNDNATGNNDGTSWTDAFTDFQAAINASFNGDTLFVGAGNYQPASGMSFIMKEGVKIYGHFAGTETSLSQRKLSSSDISSLVGNGNGVINNDFSSAAPLTANSVLDGFTIKNGNVTGDGGGMRNSYASPTVSNCIFSNNTASGNGGGMENMNASSPVISNCVFSNNTANNGGGIACHSSSAAAVDNSVLHNNTGTTQGGGVYIDNSAPAISNTIVWGNTSASGAGIYVMTGTPAVNNSDIQGGYAGTGNINSDPMFVNAATGNYRLSCGSPCVNTGDNTFLPMDIATDLSGNTRVQNGIVDMGVFEGPDANSNAISATYQSITEYQNGMISYGICGDLISTLQSSGTNPVQDSVTAIVWVETAQPIDFVKRHYQITPHNTAATATGRVTLYFSQSEFDDFNNQTPAPIDLLPAGPSDATGIAHLRIEQLSGTSNDGTGLPATYTGSTATIDPADADIVWNSTQNRWEVSFNVTGFSGFFVKTITYPLSLRLLEFAGQIIHKQDALLQWRTTDEANVLHFELERSKDAKSFDQAAVIPASNTPGIHDYRFTDYRLNSAMYYRLKMVDAGNSYTYSQVIRLVPEFAVSSSLQLHPNPATGAVTVTGVQAGGVLQITDMHGKILMQQQVQADNQVVSLQTLTPGVYILNYIYNGTSQQAKLMKQ